MFLLIQIMLAFLIGIFSAFFILKKKEDNHEHCKKKITTERNGRISAEKKLRQKVVEKISKVGYPLLVIGSVQSPYSARRGTPRQGLLVPDSRAAVKLFNDIPCETLQGLEGYSHMFIQFLFHENTNLSKTILSGNDGLYSRAIASKSTTFSDRVSAFASKVLPPLLNGGSIGLFATRSPHRPNALGLSLVRIVSVDAERRTVIVAGADLVDGTPVVDLKPWGPFDCPSCIHNTIDHEGIISCKKDSNERCHLFRAVVPDWVQYGLENPYTLPIEWTEKVKCNIVDFVESGQIKFYGPGESDILIRAITQILSLDIRSNHRGRGKGPLSDIELIGEKATHQEQNYELNYDSMHINFSVRKGGHEQFKEIPWILIDSVSIVSE